MDRSDLVVLDTVPGWEAGDVDALLVYTRDKQTPYIVARGFNADTFAWSAGSYHGDLLEAVCDLHRASYSKWTIAGCTPEDVLELYRDEYYVSYKDAERIANDVNERIGMRDNFFMAELVEEAEATLVPRSEATADDVRRFEAENEQAEITEEAYFVASKGIRPGLRLPSDQAGPVATLTPAEIARKAIEAAKGPDDGNNGGGTTHSLAKPLLEDDKCEPQFYQTPKPRAV